MNKRIAKKIMLKYECYRIRSCRFKSRAGWLAYHSFDKELKAFKIVRKHKEKLDEYHSLGLDIMEQKVKDSWKNKT